MTRVSERLEGEAPAAVRTTVVTLCVGRVPALASTVVTVRPIVGPLTGLGSQTFQIATQTRSAPSGTRMSGATLRPAHAERREPTRIHLLTPGLYASDNTCQQVMKRRLRVAYR